MKMIDELKKEYWKHFNSIKYPRGYIDEADEKGYVCECADEDTCNAKREATLKDIKICEDVLK